MNKIKKILELSLIKTLVFNIRYFGLKGLKFPCLVSKSTRFEKLGGVVKLNDYKFAGIVIGFGPIQASYNYGRWYNTGTIVFDKEAHLYRGFYIYNNGILTLGNNIKLGASKFFCEKSIRIGADTMISWECTIMDSDLHKICDNNANCINPDKEIVIGDHVWIGFGCNILKGVVIANDTIIASNSVISNKKMLMPNAIYSSGAKILKNRVEWLWEKD